MAGAVVNRELNRAARTRFAVATSADDVAIRRLLRESPMRGAVSLTFEREPNYFAGANLAGGADQTIVAVSDSRLVCMGRCTRRKCWVDGQARTVGYLGELRLDAAARGQFGILRDGYEAFHSLQRDDPVELYFTCIGSDNQRARRVLESGLRGLPRYRHLGDLETLLIAVPRQLRRPRFRIESATPKCAPALLRLLNDHAREHQLSTVWTEEALASLAAQELPLYRFLLALEGDEIVACGALWDQRPFRQTVIRHYNRALSIARPFVNAASRILGMPRLPKPGSVLAHAFLSPLAIDSQAKEMLPDFIEAIFSSASKIGVEFLTIALPVADSRLTSLKRRFSTRTWTSRIYRVDWPGEASLEIINREVSCIPDVALL
jgi:hypothetical protein